MGSCDEICQIKLLGSLINQDPPPPFQNRIHAALYIKPTHLGGEVPVKDALGVEVGHAPGDVSGDLHSHRPGELQVSVVEEVFQGAAVDVLP